MRVSSKGKRLSVPFGLPLPRSAIFTLLVRRLFRFVFFSSIVGTLNWFYMLWNTPFGNKPTTLDVARYIDSLFH